jgi:hypothetical protein
MQGALHKTCGHNLRSKPACSDKSKMCLLVKHSAAAPALMFLWFLSPRFCGKRSGTNQRLFRILSWCQLACRPSLVSPCRCTGLCTARPLVPVSPPTWCNNPGCTLKVTYMAPHPRSLHLFPPLCPSPPPTLLQGCVQLGHWCE